MREPEGKLLREVGEKRMVARFRELAAGALRPDVVVGPGDDAAVIRVADNRLLLVTCDMMVEGVHFRREWATPRQIGWKAMATNLSDIAAMGGEPAAAVGSVAAPGGVSRGMVEGIAEGLIACASEYGASLVGGDLVGSPGPLVVDVSVTGWVEEDRVLRRAGAQPGEAILVTGGLGAAAAGLLSLQKEVEGGGEVTQARLAHLEPRPRLAEARMIAATRLATAMMDLSDGLADDLPRLCRESGAGARLMADHIPVHPACRAVAGLCAADPLALAVSGGEDYELLFTCPRHAVEEIRQAVASASGAALTVIGEVLAGEGVTMVTRDGREQGLGCGFDHFRASPPAG